MGGIPSDSSDKSPGIRPPLKESYRNDQSYHRFRTACGGSRETNPVAARADRPRAPAGGVAASRALVAPSPPERLRWARHLHRCVPLPARPFFFIARPHTGRFFALLDGVLTPSSPTGSASFSTRGKDMPTRPLVQGQTSITSTTKVPIGQHRGIHATKTTRPSSPPNPLHPHQTAKGHLGCRFV